jgi:hypothetical protein
VINVVDDRTSSIEFQLPPRLPEITVSGRTVSPDGAPIQGVSLFLHDVDAIVGFSDISIATSDQHVVSGTGMTLKWLRRAAEWQCGKDSDWRIVGVKYRHRRSGRQLRLPSDYQSAVTSG